jgi:hypothetical protein
VLSLLLLGLLAINSLVLHSTCNMIMIILVIWSWCQFKYDHDDKFILDFLSKFGNC